MKDRSERLLHVRPGVKTSQINTIMGSEERFQNETLRPIIKLQNNLLIEAFKNYVRKHKNVFHDLSVPKKLEYIEKAIQKDIKFRNSLKGMLIGLLTVEEFQLYTQNSSALNKRMMNMVIERLKDQVQSVTEDALVY